MAELAATGMAAGVTTGLPVDVHAAVERRLGAGDLELPMLPQVASEILAEGDGESTDLRHLSDLLHRDQVLAAHVLRIANSAAYAGDTRIQSIQQALIRIGVQQMRQIVVSIALQGKVFADRRQADLVAELWRHSTVTGLYAKEVARALRSNVESAFVCGLLHDVGKPVVLGLVLDVCAAAGQLPTREVCVGALDTFHNRVGRILAERWDLPQPVVDAIALHHDAEVTPDLGKAVYLTALADVLAYAAVKSDEDCAAEHALLEGHPLLVALNLYPDDVQGLFGKRAAVLELAAALTS